MSEAVFNRIVAIIENGTYDGNLSLGANAVGLRTFPENLDSIGKPAVLILPRGDTGWIHEAGANEYKTNLSYDLYFYIQEAIVGNDAIGLADASNLNIIATQVFLSRPQLQLTGNSDIPEIMGNIGWQTTSNLATPIPYPPAGVSSSQGAKFYWGFIIRLSVPYRLYIRLI